ncbi:MAG TPA: type II toxin-antitoxin system RelE/ParE family toxin [Beijerinckiaceae bacterium]|nr:type II toxin-antitoxin system RelE/ParE family toxin [Beijerinckiaceae bacterium]
MKVVWTGRAASGLRSARRRIAKVNPTAAARFADRTVREAAKLGQYPRLGRVGRVEGTRELVVAGTPYLVAYRITATEVQILAVIHGARRWPKSL